MILFLVVIWFALIYWTYADARRRIADPLLIGCATLASGFPYVGTIVYMIVRPPEYLDDVRERELEMQAAEARLAELGYHLCPHCDYEVEKDFLRCPNCMRKLKDPCHACGRPLDPTWKVCPFCEAEIGMPSSPSGRARCPPTAPSRRELRAARRRAAVDHLSVDRVACRPLDPLDPSKEARRRGAHAHPRQARCLCPQPDRRDRRPVRAQRACAWWRSS